MARTVSLLGLSPRRASFPRPSWELGAGLVALCLPLVFLHVRFQPAVVFQLGSTDVGARLSDLAVLAVAAAGLAAGLARGFGTLRAARSVWIGGGAFLVLILAATLYPLAWQEDYRFLTHLVTAAKFGEYALLAPALALLLRERRDFDALLWALAAWSAAATAWGVLQFVGVAPAWEGAGKGKREPSFVGVHDFAALSAAALALSLAVLALRAGTRSERRLAWLAGVGGAVGLVLSAALAGLIGVILAGLAAALVARGRGILSTRRAAWLAGILAAVTVGVLLMRAGSIADFARFLGLGEPARERRVETYVHRTLLAYIGLRIFLDHPVIGVGWQGSEELENYGPYLDDAHRRFPGSPEQAFPSPERPWGVQNAYLQALADMGVVGFAALAGFLGAALVLGSRAARRAPPALALPALAGLAWLLVTVGAWNGLGLVAGIPLVALTWIAAGLIAAGAAEVARARA